MVNSISRDQTLTTERDNWALGISKRVFRTDGSYEASLKLVQADKLNSCARWVLDCGLPGTFRELSAGAFDTQIKDDRGCPVEEEGRGSWFLGWGCVFLFSLPTLA